MRSVGPEGAWPNGPAGSLTTEKADEDLCSATERLVFRGYYQELLFYGGGIQNLATKDLDQK